MKLLLIGVCLMSCNSYAYQYNCAGIDRGSPNQDNVEFGFTLLKDTVQLSHPIEGDQMEFDYISSSGKITTYGDYGWDGYGGFVEIQIPSFVVESDHTIDDRSFTIYFKNDTYSESGLSSSIDVKATCEANLEILD